MWWKFRRHRLAVLSTILLALAYLVAALAGFVAPYASTTRSQDLYAPPQRIRFLGASGRFHLRPFVYGLILNRDPKTWQPIYTPDTEQIHPLYFCVTGDSYKLFGLFRSRVHLFGVQTGEIHLAGTDALGLDLFSRLVYGAQISLSVGLISVVLSLGLGLLLGGISGLYGGLADSIIQRLIETLRAIPSIPLWMGLAAAIPRDWTSVQQYFAILAVLSLISWTGVARVARGRFLAIREQDFIMAAQLYGCSQWRVIGRHLIPSIMSYIIVRLTLSIPGIILGETALSFLGIGLRPPVVSWGVLLQAAQKYMVISFYPWLWIGPALCVVLIVIAFNFVGDGARDAADPFSH